MTIHNRRFGKILSKFRKNKEGSVAVEFGMLALPFAMVVFAVLESCVSFAAQQVMANATDEVARQVRTGQLRNATEAQIKTQVCNHLKMITTASCPDRMTVDLRSYASFADAAKVKIKLKNGQVDTTGFAVAPGGASTRNMLRIFYRWPAMTDIMRQKMSNLSDGSVLHVATATWKNEPFE